MNKLITLIFLITFGIPTIKVLIFYATQKLLHTTPTTKTERSSGVNAEAERISKYFNSLLKAKKLKYDDINVIYKILKKYSIRNIKYQNDIHFIYTILKYSKGIRMQDLGNIEVYLDCVKNRKC